jgi:hypothetical protein
MTSTDQPGAHHYTNEEMHNEDVAHEHADVNIRTLIVSGLALMVLVAVSAALMYGLFMVFEKQAEARDPQLSPVAPTSSQAPQGPQLLTNEPANLQKFRQEEATKLEGAGWMDQKGGIARVPIELAKKLIVQHGLPVRAGAVDDPSEGTHAPAYGESSGGRRIPIKPQTSGAVAPQQPGAQGAQEIKK